MIKQLSPSEEMAFAIQLGRLERGEPPIDINTWTISKENVKVGRVLGSVFSRFDSDVRRVHSGVGFRYFAYGNGVVRVSARGKDLIPQA
jgi:hypothetical protein